MDTNGDGFLTPADVLIVINFLNSDVFGEGEGPVATGEGEGLATSQAIFSPGFHEIRLPGDAVTDADILSAGQGIHQGGDSETTANQLLVGFAVAQYGDSRGSDQADSLASVGTVTSLEDALDDIVDDLASAHEKTVQDEIFGDYS